MISGGKTLVLQANLMDTVEMIHQRIQSITGIPVMEQRLIYNGKQLQWEHTLEECSVQNDAGLQLVGRMRSTGHPRAWRVINDMVSVIFRLCRKEIPNYSSSVVRGKLEQYMTLPLNKQRNKFASLFIKRATVKHANEAKELNSDDNAEEEEEEDDEEGGRESDWCGSINKIDYCKIFVDACAPQALVMLYMSSDKNNRDCAEVCISSFVGFVKDLGCQAVERSFCATVVLEFCKLLRPAGAEENVIYLYCRSTLGLMLEKIEVVSGPKDIYGISAWGTTCIAIQDVFPFFKELGLQLLKDLVLSVECKANIGQLVRDVCDFAAFLQPMLAFTRRRLAIPAAVQKAKGKVGPLGEEVDHLFNLFNDLLGQIDKCLCKMEMCPDKKKENDFKIYQGGWSQYLAILKELSSISVLFPGSEDQFLTMMTQNKEALRDLVLRYATRMDDYSWLNKYKDVLDFESRKHLAMLMFPEVSLLSSNMKKPQALVF